MREIGLIEIDRFFSSMESVALVVTAYEFHLREDGTRWSELFVTYLSRYAYNIFSKNSFI